MRALELKNNDPAMWNRLQLLMDHDEDRKLEVEYQDMFQVKRRQEFQFHYFHVIFQPPEECCGLSHQSLWS